MKLALDIDDTITRHPAFFAFLTRALRAAGHEVIVISYRVDRAGAERDLTSWGITYDQLLLWSNDLPLDEMDAWKGRVCAEQGVDVFFEDDPITIDNVPEGTLCFLAVDRRAHDLIACARDVAG